MVESRRTHSQDEELERRQRPPPPPEQHNREKESRRRSKRGRRREREEEEADRSSPGARRSHRGRRQRASRSASEESNGRRNENNRSSRKRRRQGSHEAAAEHPERRRDHRKSHRRKKSSGRRSARHVPPVEEESSPSRGAGRPARAVSEDDSEHCYRQQQHGNAGRARSASTHDDAAGHFAGGPGTVLAGRYRILQEVGRGTFGRVVESIDLNRPRRAPYVAIKIVRAVSRYRESAMVEAAVVDAANRRGGRGLTHCVVMHDAFTFEGHYCMVFESLGPSLYDFLKMHDYRPFPMVCVQDFAVQLLETMEFLHSFGLIHTDLKIENILLMNGREVNYRNQRVPESNRIKVIDFGGATYDHDRKSTVINTRQYRAPEVILGMGWSMPSDMWSIGCILAELYQGELLFATHDSIEHLALMEHIIGCFPRRLLKAARKSMADVFDSAGRHRLDRLSPEDARFVRKSARLDSIVRDPEDYWFLGLLRRLLCLDPQERATAHECLQYLSHYRRDVVRYG